MSDKSAVVLADKEIDVGHLPLWIYPTNLPEKRRLELAADKAVDDEIDGAVDKEGDLRRHVDHGHGHLILDHVERDKEIVDELEAVADDKDGDDRDGCSGKGFLQVLVAGG